MLKKVIRFLTGLIATVLIVPFVQTPAAKLAEKLGFDATLSDRWEGVVRTLSDLAANPWYIFAAGVAAGFTLAVWLESDLLRREPLFRRKFEKPKLSIGGLNVIGGNGNETTSYLLFVTVDNPGKEIAIKKWELIIAFPDGTRRIVPATHVLEPISFRMAVGDPLLVTPEVSLVGKQDTIFPPGQKSGRILFSFMNSDYDMAASVKTIIELVAQANENRITTNPASLEEISRGFRVRRGN